jgi:hypothetical protein
MGRRRKPRVDIKALHRERARELWGRLTPFRLGILVGQTGIGINEPNPYPGQPHAARGYEEGIKHAQKRPEKSE